MFQSRRFPFTVAVLSLLALAGLNVDLHATEITVKNDDVTEFGSAVIVGDFVPGEEAAAWLTAPVSGSIVAVEILWLEGTSGHPASIEQAIHIYDGGTFPVPGAELETLVAPYLTPGFFNQFRYLDDNMTIPLNVPVTAGQVFVVSLEFANGTNVGGGGPSVVRDINGCQTGKNGLYATPGTWWNSCLLGIFGDWAIRAVIDDSIFADTVEADLTCLPNSGTVPFVSAMSVGLTNTYTGLTRRVAAHLDVTLPNGSAYTNWKSGWSNIAAGTTFTSSWNQTIPALGSVIGQSFFQLFAEDVTPSPYNQAPHPPSGSTDTGFCVVQAIAP